jgi:hypothetical protein
VLGHIKTLDTRIKAQLRHLRQCSPGQFIAKVSIKKRDDHFGAPAALSQGI